MSKEVYYFYKSKGICVDCKREKAFGGRVRCIDCLEKINKKQRERYNLENGKEKARVYTSIQRDKYKLDGKCSCGKKIDDRKYKSCSTCRRKARERYYAKVERNLSLKDMWREDNLCVRCGKPRYQDSMLCEHHYKLSVENIEKNRESQAYRNFKKY